MEEGGYTQKEGMKTDCYFSTSAKLQTEHLGPIGLAGWEVLVRVLVRRHDVVVVVLDVATTSAPYVLQDEFNVICRTENAPYSRSGGGDRVRRSQSNRPLGLATEFPCCRRLASLRMSITRVANSCALNLASFCRP